MVKKSRSTEDIQKAYDALPLEIKQVLDGAELVTLIPTIGAKYQLHVDQMGYLEAEITDVLVGFEETKNLPANLMSSLGIERQKADAIAQDINDMLFLKIRETMKKITVQTSPAQKSVVMPSKSVSPAPPVPQKPVVPPIAPAPKVSPAADMMLTQPTMSLPTGQAGLPAKKIEPPQAKAETPKPKPYAADPYREPAE